MSDFSENSKQDVKYQLWGSKELVTDATKSSKRVIQEVMHDLAPRHNFQKQHELHEKIRNDDDYDDWEYGTEPEYGVFLKSS